MHKTKVRLVTYAWGRTYLDKLLNYTLASVLSQRNLPALAAEFQCEVVLLTEEALFDHVRRHPVAQRVEEIAPLHLLPLDDLIGESWQYGMTLSRTLHRGMADLGTEMTETYFLFLNGDFVLADGSYERLIPHMKSGERALLSPSYCVKGETVTALLDAQRRDNLAISLPPRAMAKLILEQRHNTVRAKTVNQNVVHYRYMDQFYWEVDANTLIGFQMPIALVALRPEVALDEVTSFWDWGVVYDFCPSKRLTVLGDSDEFLMLELRGEADYADLLMLGWSRPEVIASRMRGYITQYQVDNSRLPLTLHAAEVPSPAVTARGSLEKFRDTALRSLPSTPIDHRGHASWEYHKTRFSEFQKNRPLWREIGRLREEIRDSLVEEQAERQRLRRDYARRRSVLEDTLDEVLRGQSPAVAAAATSPEGEGLVKRIYHRVLGRMPAVRPWHPLYLPYQQAAAAVARTLAASDGRRVLFVCDPQSPLHRSLANLPRCDVISTKRLFDKRRQEDPGPYDECFINLLLEHRDDVVEVVDADLVVDAAFASVKKGGKLTIHIANVDSQSPELWGADLAKCLVRKNAKMHLAHTGSWPAVTAIRAFNWGLAAWAVKVRWWPLKVMLSLAVSVPLAVLAYFLETRFRQRIGVPTIERFCTSVAIEVDLAASA